MVNEVSLARTQEALAGRYSISVVKGPIDKVTSVTFRVRFWASICFWGDQLGEEQSGSQGKTEPMEHSRLDFAAASDFFPYIL